MNWSCHTSDRSTESCNVPLAMTAVPLSSLAEARPTARDSLRRLNRDLSLFGRWRKTIEASSTSNDEHQRRTRNTQRSVGGVS